jgi:hypothetical protein
VQFYILLYFQWIALALAPVFQLKSAIFSQIHWSAPRAAAGDIGPPCKLRKRAHVRRRENPLQIIWDLWLGPGWPHHVKENIGPRSIPNGGD